MDSIAIYPGTEQMPGGSTEDAQIGVNAASGALQIAYQTPSGPVVTSFGMPNIALADFESDVEGVTNPYWPVGDDSRLLFVDNITDEDITVMYIGKPDGTATAISSTGGETMDSITTTDPDATNTIAGDLQIDGNVNVGVNKLVVNSTSGNTDVAGILTVAGAGNITGNFQVGASKFVVLAASGNTTISGTLGVAGQFAIATDKFVVAASGNTNIAGTLACQSAISSTVSVAAPSFISAGLSGLTQVITLAGATSITVTGGIVTATA